MSCFITRTSSFLPGDPVDNDHIENYMGRIWGETKIRKKILAANKIKQRYYAQDRQQQPTHDVYKLASAAIRKCLENDDGGLNEKHGVSYLSAGTTNTPLVAPGLASIVHSRLNEDKVMTGPVEINSNSGICSSAAQAFVNGYRAIKYDNHESAICVGAEHPSEILKSKNVRPRYDLVQMYREVKKSNWFMTVFLRFMLSDGAGAFLLQNRKASEGISYEVNWTFSQSFANETPLCMKLENRNLLLSQDVAILSKYLGPTARKFFRNAMAHHNDHMQEYKCFLPHISSYFFTRELKSILREQMQGTGKKLEFWTNLASVGNMGAASIFVLLDEYTKTENPQVGDKLLLFVPESGQFNYVLVSLTVV